MNRQAQKKDASCATLIIGSWPSSEAFRERKGSRLSLMRHAIEQYKFDILAQQNLQKFWGTDDANSNIDPLGQDWRP